MASNDSSHVKFRDKSPRKNRAQLRDIPRDTREQGHLKKDFSDGHSAPKRQLFRKIATIAAGDYSACTGMGWRTGTLICINARDSNIAMISDHQQLN